MISIVNRAMRLGIFAVLAAALLGAGCFSTSPNLRGRNADPAHNRSEELSTDLLRPNDIVIITFSGVTSPPAPYQDRIREDGMVVLPFIEPILAAGKTRTQLEQEIHKAYVPAYYTRLTVSVNADVRYFYVYGEVKREGQHSYLTQMTVLKAIAAAGGFTDFARKSKVQLTRSTGEILVVDCVDALTKVELDLPVYPDDRIFIPRRFF